MRNFSPFSETLGDTANGDAAIIAPVSLLCLHCGEHTIVGRVVTVGIQPFQSERNGNASKMGIKVLKGMPRPEHFYAAPAVVAPSWIGRFVTTLKHERPDSVSASFGLAVSRLRSARILASKAATAFRMLMHKCKLSQREHFAAIAPHLPHALQSAAGISMRWQFRDKNKPVESLTGKQNEFHTDWHLPIVLIHQKGYKGK